MNKVILIGRLGKDPELRYSQQGMPICNFRIATDESYTDRDGNRVDKAEWHSIVCFQRPAENCAKFLAKGSQVAVEGSLQTRKWQDQQGQDRYTTEIKASRVEFLSRAQSQNGQPQDAGDGGQYYDDGYDQGQGSYQGGNANAGQRPNGNGQRTNGNGQRGNQSRPQGNAGSGQRGNTDYGAAFPGEASGMDDVPF